MERIVPRRFLAIIVPVLLLFAAASAATPVASAWLTPPTSGSWSVSADDKEDVIVQDATEAVDVEVTNNATEGHVLVVVRDTNGHIASQTQIDAGDSAAIGVTQGQDLEVHYVDTDSTGTWEHL